MGRLAGMMIRTGFVGAGKLGSSLAKTLLNTDHKVTFFNNGSHTVSSFVHSNSSIPVENDSSVFLNNSDVFIISVQDRLIANVDNELLWPSGSVVLHCSGSLDSSVLKNAKSRQCHTGSLHLVTSLSGNSSEAREFDSLPVIFEGDGKAQVVAKQLCAPFAHPFITTSAENKRLHHLACMFTVNFLPYLLNRASELWKDAGIGETDQHVLMQALLRDYLANLDRNNVPESASGPIPRGDGETIRNHLQGIEATGRTTIGDEFRYHCQKTAEMLLHNGIIESDWYEEMLNLLRSDIKT
jgi:predicted short-subunit dehydrogenase-like oxidoreductase (DUF2520 family)